MNRVWEIRESHRKSDEGYYDDHRGRMSSRRGKMSSYKDKDEYSEYEEGYCDALDALDAFLDEHYKK